MAIGHRMARTGSTWTGLRSFLLLWCQGLFLVARISRCAVRVGAI